ncbi:MAG TPA: metallophosphoesterase [Coriobacteriia bacterium]|jgi:3',5'-cyclic AMP phosphodiesterase CpdA
MGRIAYVCMSDLHLGADSSLLTRLSPGEPADVSDLARSLQACLESLLVGNGEPKPTLVLLGDVLELALARDEDSATAFQRFAELVMRTDRELFGEVVYVPGNHDHHLWEGAREAQYAAYVGRREAGEPLEAPWHSTRMLRESDPTPLTSPLLTALLHRARPSAEEQLGVATVYPNLGLRRDGRLVAFHHGHFQEAAYRLLTTLDGYAFGSPEPEWVWDLEADNFAWIDFFWSGLGRSGSAGTHVNHIFNHLQDPEGREELVDDLSRGFSQALRVAPWPWLERLADPGEELLIHGLLQQLAALGDTLGRRAYYGGKPPEQALNEGLTHYVGKYVTGQILRECAGELPGELTFVFGHTHSPFEKADVRVGDGGIPWQVFNTGGWVHESAQRQPRIGASLVLLDEELTPVALRLYDEGADFSTWRVHAEEAAEAHSAFFEQVQDALASDPGPWAAFVRLADEAIGEACERFEHATE